MKRAFSTVACMDSTWKETVDAAVRADMQAIEIRLCEDGSIWGLEKEALDEFLLYLQSWGIEISDLGTSVALFDYEPVKIEHAKAAVRLAGKVNAKGIRVFLTPFEKRFSVSAKYCYEGIVRALKELSQYGIEYGVEIWVETHNEFSTGEALAGLLRDVDCGNLKVIWDVMHPLERGEKPEETLRYLGDRIVHVHLKDGRRASDADMIDFVYTKLGAGEVPVRRILALLKKAGYDGYLSLEWENAWRTELQGCYKTIDDLLQDFNEYLNALEIPPVLPPSVHPRLMVLEADVERVRKNLDAPENALAYSLWKELCETAVTGCGATPEYGTYHLKEYLAVEARAFRALLYPDKKEYAREAIDSVFCLLDSFVVHGGNMAARWGGHLIFLCAQVYDWCYPHLSDTEKETIIKRCEQIAEDTFEMGYPPVKQTALSGHGSEAQLQRDLLAFSIAVCDERPDIYHFCGNRLWEEYRETNAFHFSSHAHMQGPTYGAYRYTWTLWAALLTERMSGCRLFDENLGKTAYYFLDMLRPDGESFRLGDDCMEGKAEWLQKCPVTVPMFLAAVYTGDGHLMDYFQKHCCRRHLLPEKYGMDFYNEDSYGEGALSPVTVLLWNRLELYNAETVLKPHARYFPGPLGMTVWKDEEKQTAVLMKIGELWGSNHDHLDTGCFQIFHRAILASDSGIYDSYHSDHRKNYLIRTSAHNCITVKNPDACDECWEDADGGVRRPMDGAEPGDIHEWQRFYRMATVVSHEETEHGCEITGDLTMAYQKNCEKVIRNMKFDAQDGPYGVLTVTDDIVSKRSDFIKTFHLHTQTEPVIRENEILIENGEGCMRCFVLSPQNAKIIAVGGGDQAFLTEGDAWPPDGIWKKGEEGWGQVLIRPAKQALHDRFVVRMELYDRDDFRR